MALEPGDAEALADLADICRAEGDCERALALYRRAARAEPGAGRHSAGIIECLMDLGREREALKEARHYALGHPKSAGAHFRLGQVLRRQDRLVEAIDHLEQAVSLDPGSRTYRQELKSAAQMMETLRRTRTSP